MFHFHYAAMFSSTRNSSVLWFFAQRFRKITSIIPEIQVWLPQTDRTKTKDVTEREKTAQR
jgi:hypothetical protein